MVFNKGSLVLSHTLLLTKGWPQSENLKKKEKSQEIKQLI